MKNPYIVINSYVSGEETQELHYTITIPRENGETRINGVGHFHKPIEIPIEEDVCAECGGTRELTDDEGNTHRCWKCNPKESGDEHLQDR